MIDLKRKVFIVLREKKGITDEGWIKKKKKMTKKYKETKVVVRFIKIC